MQKLKHLLGIGDSKFYRTMLAICLPIMLQQGLSSALYMIDNIMVGQLGETAISAVGVANQLTFLLQIFGMGISGGAGVFAAQYWGRKDIAGIRRVQGIALGLSLVVGVLFTCAGLFFAQPIASIFSHDPAVIDLAVSYLSIASYGYLFQMVALVLCVILRASGDSVLPLKATAAAVLVNGVFNYIFIFGKLGLAPMGVRGAALATVIASVVNAGVLVFISYRKRNAAAASLKEMTNFDGRMLGSFAKVSGPVFINEALWSLGITMYSVLYGILGTKPQAAMQIYTTIDRLGFVLMAGLGSACGVLVGNLIGAGETEKARLYSKRMMIISPLSVGIIGILLQFAAPLFMKLFAVEPDVSEMAMEVVRIYCGVLWIYALNFTIIVGTLRAGGDTIYATITDVCGLWAVSLPLAFFTGLVLNWPLWAIFAVTVAGDLTKSVMGLLRVRTGKWIRVLQDPDE